MAQIKNSNGDTLDIRELSLEIEITNPIFSEIGSGSLPVLFPDSPANKKFFGYPHRADRSAAPAQDIPITLQEGASSRQGKIVIAEASADGYDATILFDESDFYGKIAETKLGDITGLPVVGGGSVDSLVSSLKYVYQNFQSFDSSSYLVSDWMYEVNVYPVIISKEDDATTATPEKYRWMNEPNFTITGVTIYPLIGETAYTVTETNNGASSAVNYPKGYGLVPFIKLHRVLHYVMDHCGYTIVENVFATDNQLKQANLLNNIVDIICDGMLNFADMMPDCTISDLLQLLKSRFGAFIFINSTNKTAQIKLFKDLKNSTPTNITSLKGGAPKITFPTKKALKLSAGKSFSPSKTSHDTYELFLKRWDSIIPTLNYHQLGSPANTAALVYRLANTGVYWVNSPIDPSSADKFYSSPFFTYDKRDTSEYEEWTSPDEQLTMDIYFDELVAPLYLAGRRHKKTALVGVSDTEKDGEDSTPLALCFYKGRGVTYSDTNTKFFYGSILAINNQATGTTSNFYFDMIYQGTTGLFNVFLKDYDACLRAAFETYTQKFNLPAIYRNSFDTSCPLLVDNQIFIPEKITWTSGRLSTDVLMRSIRLLRDVSSEQSIPELYFQLYKWVAWDNISEIVEAKRQWLLIEANFLATFPQFDNANFASIVSITFVSWTNTAPSAGEFDYLKYPNDTDYAIQRKVLYDYSVSPVYRIDIIYSNHHHIEDMTLNLIYQSGVIAALI